MLKILNLGGVSVQKNMFLYETENEAMLVDCGIGFPEEKDYGVDLIIPDFKYVLGIKDKLKGLLLTHAHEDHYSATPYLLREMSLNIYAHPMVQDFLLNKLKDFKDANKPKFISIEPHTPFRVGNDFELTPYRVNHSVPNTLGFFVKTSSGTVVHQTDFKFDWTPIMDKPADIRKISSLAEHHNPVLMLSDSLGATHFGYTRSEKYIEDSFDDVIKDAPGMVVITTMSSNISRIQQALSSAKSHNRKVVVSGYSIEKNLEVVIKHNIINIPEGTLISDTEMSNYKDNELLLVVPGNYGQVGSTLDKLSKGEHKRLRLPSDVTVVFSGDPIPGMEPQVDKVIDRLTLLGAHVVYSELQEDLHVSGHGSRGDLTLMAQLIKPKYFWPIGGGIKHMRAYKDMLVAQGFEGNNVFELLDGETLEVTGDIVKRGQKIEIEEVYIDNSSQKNSVESIVLKDRKFLADNGVVFVVLPTINGEIKGDKVEIYTRGFIYVKENLALLNGMKKNVQDTLNRSSESGENKDFSNLKRTVEKALSKHLYKRIGEAPMIVVEGLSI